MHFTITFTSLLYDGNDYLSYTVNGVRSDNPTSVSTYSSSVQVGTAGAYPTAPFDTENNKFIYQIIAADVYTSYCSYFSFSQDPVNYIFLGLSIVGPFKLTLPMLIDN